MNRQPDSSTDESKRGGLLSTQDTCPKKNEDALCDKCGAYGAFEFDGHRLCEDCYGTAGACCQ